MGLLDELKGQLSERLGLGANVNTILEQAMNIINNPATGGFAGTIEAFKKEGLGKIISSWISTGQNMPISADQILQVLGADKIEKVAQKIGIPQETLLQQLGVYLPQIIDKLTPKGEMPNPSILSDGLNMLKKTLSK